MYSRIPGDFNHARPVPPTLELLPRRLPPPPLPPRPLRPPRSPPHPPSSPPPLPPRSRPHPPPPPTLFQSSAVQNEENVDTYSIISGNSEHFDSQSVTQDQDCFDLYEDVTGDLVKKNVQGVTEIWEKHWQEDDKHVRGLIGLNNPNLTFLEVVEVDSHYWIVSPESPNGDLKEYVLDRKCKLGDIVTYLSQVASALHYLHVNHIVHGDLRAEYVNVVAPDKVQVGRMGRSKSLTMSVYEVTSTTSVVQANMPPDAIRWSAPEVISDGLYTHASDVWSLGILAWELYTSFTAGQAQRDSSVPYCDLNDHEILPYMRDKGPLDRPENCPDWIHIIMHQCWTFDSAQRPPLLAIVDCLTSRKPMMSWIMQLWLGNHDKSEWPDLDICQPEDACHVTDAEMHPSKHNMEKLCSEDFFEDHSYSYIDIGGEIFPRKSSKEEDDVDYVNDKRCQNGQDDHFSGTTHKEIYEDYEGNDKPAANSPEGREGNGEHQNVLAFRKVLSFWVSLVKERDQTRDAPRVRARREIKSSKEGNDVDDAKCKICQNGQYHHFSETTHNEDYEGNDVPSSFDQDDCGKYDKPAEANNPQDSKHRAECLNVVQEIDDPYGSLYDMPVSNIPKARDKPAEANNPQDSKHRAECLNVVQEIDDPYCSLYDKPAAIIPKAKRENEEYKNKANQKDKDDCSKYDKRTKNISKGGKKNENYQQQAHNMNQDACTIYEEPTAKFPQNKGGNNEEYQNKTGNKQKQDCSIDNKPVACISELEREKSENLQTRAPKLDQGVCPMNDKTAANSPEGREGNGEYQNVLAFRKARSFWASLVEDKDQTRNAPRVRARREIKSSKSSKEDDDVDDANCKRCQNGQDDHFSGTTHNEDYEDYEGNDVPSSFDQNDCAKHDKPAEANNPQESKHRAEYLNMVQVIDEHHCSLYSMQVSYTPKAKDNCAMDDKPAAIIPKAKRENEEYKNKANQKDENDCSKYDKQTPNISKVGKKNENCQQKAQNMNQDACTIGEEPTAKFPQDKGENEEYQDKTRNKQKRDCPIDKKPVARISEEREKNESLQSRAPKLDQGVCPMNDKPAANSPEGREGNGEYQNVLTFRKALSFGTSLVEDNDQTRNAPRVRARKELKWQIKDTFMKTQPQRPSSFHEK